MLLYTQKHTQKWINDLNLRLDTIKLLEAIIGRTLSDINYSKIFFDLFPTVIKIKIYKWDLIKLKSFCTAKETINKMKRQPTEWEKIFTNKATNKKLISNSSYSSKKKKKKDKKLHSKNGQI